MRNKIKNFMKDMMMNNASCGYVFVQNGVETYEKNMLALDAYMKAYNMSSNGDVECYMAPTGPKNKAFKPVCTVVGGIVTISGQVVK